MALTPFAYDDKYVVPSGAGANNGTSFADAWDLSQIAINQATARRWNLAGTFTQAAIALNWNTNAARDTPILYRGWKADLSVPSVFFDDMPIITGSGSSLIVGNMTMLNGLRLSTFSTIGNATNDNIIYALCEIFNNTNQGILSDNICRIDRCRIHDNGSHGVESDIALHVTNSEIYDNTGDGVFLSSTAGTVISSFIARNGGDGINCTNGGEFLLNTIDGNTNDGISAPISTANTVQILANQITNNGNGIAGVGASFVKDNNLFGNTTESTGTIGYLEGNTAVNPDYVDVANNDYEIQEASLIGVDIPLLGNVNIGAWQNVGGGGGGGMLIHPGMSGGCRG